MIIEREIKKYDNIFGTKSRYFPCTNTITVETPLDSWQIKITNKQKPYCLLHKKRRMKQLLEDMLLVLNAIPNRKLRGKEWTTYDLAKKVEEKLKETNG